ncbi:MAG TPA: response regulator transcription factor [Solirubrobacteraceae bacterium]|nr:response regulator transcription factor [Solirubrobacteraceae bacterium]
MKSSLSKPSARIHAAEQSEAVVLLAEESPTVGCELVEQLRADSYRASLAHSPEHARVLARAQPIRALLLGELDAPRGALDLLEEVRHPSSASLASVWDEHLPIIVLGPSARQLDLLRAFEMGADDFIAREGHCYLELRARLKALLRRAEQSSATRLCVGALEVDTSAHLVRVAGAPVEVCRLEYELLVHLARNPTGVCTKQELLRAIWHQPVSAGARTVDSHASRLRRKLDLAGAHGFVVNVWGVGYRLV